MARVAGRFRSALMGGSLAEEVVDYVEGAEPPPIPERVWYEVDRPAAVDLLASNQWHLRKPRPSL